jgi:hypothetical protein
MQGRKSTHLAQVVEFFQRAILSNRAVITLQLNQYFKLLHVTTWFYMTGRARIRQLDNSSLGRGELTCTLGNIG